MSEESSSTPLRLKPKLKVEGEAPAGDGVKTPALPVPTPADAPSAIDGAAPLKLKPKMGGSVAIPASTPAAENLAPATESRVRLKPKLTIDAEPAAVATPVPERLAEPAPPPPALFAGPPSAPAALAPDVVVPPTFKLRPKDAVVQPTAVVADPPPPVALPPLMSEPAPEVAQAPKPALRVKPSAELIKSFEDPPAVGRSPGKRSKRPVMLALLLLMVGIAGAYFGYSTFVAPGQSAPLAKPVAASPADSGPTSMAGQMVAKAQDVLTTRAANGEGMEELGIESRTGANDIAIAPAEGVMAAMPARRELPPEPEPEPSAAFNRFVTEMKVSGVFQGVPPRAMINGRTIRAGEPVDHGLGIVFTGIDVERRLIFLQDASGAKISKKY